MRVFQIITAPRDYYTSFDRYSDNKPGYSQRIYELIADRYGACHLLAPVIDQSPNGFIAFGNDAVSQRLWAMEKSVRKGGAGEILLAQIEYHRTEVLYSLDPVMFGSDFLRRLPGCVRRTICWRAAPTPKSCDMSGWDIRVCNFPSIISAWRRQGLRAEYFSPAYDPAMGEESFGSQRVVDVGFVGGWSRHHLKRREILSAIADVRHRHKVELHLSQSLFTKYAGLAGRFTPFFKNLRIPGNIQQCMAPPVYGRRLYRALSSMQIVVNGAIDMAGNERGNMRCFESMGCGAVMLGDEGLYPEGMVANQNFLMFSRTDQIRDMLERALKDKGSLNEMRARALKTISTLYSRERQWERFQRIALE